MAPADTAAPAYAVPVEAEDAPVLDSNPERSSNDWLVFTRHRQDQLERSALARETTGKRRAPADARGSVSHMVHTRSRISHWTAARHTRYTTPLPLSRQELQYEHQQEYSTRTIESIELASPRMSDNGSDAGHETRCYSVLAEYSNH